MTRSSSDHTTPSDARPAPPRAAAPRITSRPVQPPLPASAAAEPTPTAALTEATTTTGAPVQSEAPIRAGAAVDSLAPAHLRTLPSWLLSQASAAAARLVDDALSTEGVRRQDYRVLVALDEAGAASQADLGRSVWLDRSDLHGVVTELESRGLLSREPDRVDRRRKVVTLTADGRTTLARLTARVDHAQQLLLAGLPQSDRDTLVRLLSTLVNDGDSEVGA